MIFRHDSTVEYVLRFHFQAIQSNMERSKVNDYDLQARNRCFGKWIIVLNI